MAQRGRRVFKKACASGRLTVYLGRRDFYTTKGMDDIVDGMVKADPADLQGQGIFVRLRCTLNYGIDDVNALGVKMQTTLFSEIKQVYPPPEGMKLTALQRKLQSKLENNAFPFKFEVPEGLPNSVTLQGQPGARGQDARCGVDWDLKIYIADTAEDRPSKRNTVVLAIRKLAFAPLDESDDVAPSDTAVKKLALGGEPITMQVFLDRRTYMHGDPIEVTVKVDNGSKKQLKNMDILVRQFATLKAEAGLSGSTRKTHIVEMKPSVHLPIAPSSQWAETFAIIPSVEGLEDQYRLALDGQIKDEPTGLASSTQLTQSSLDDNVGIFVSYEVKVKLHVGMGSELDCKTPFMLLAPPPNALGVSVGIEPPPTPALVKDAENDGYMSVPTTPRNAPRMTFDELDRMMDNDGDLDLVFEDFVNKRAEKFFSQPDRDVEEYQDDDDDDE